MQADTHAPEKKSKKSPQNPRRSLEMFPFMHHTACLGQWPCATSLRRETPKEEETEQLQGVSACHTIILTALHLYFICLAARSAGSAVTFAYRCTNQVLRGCPQNEFGAGQRV